MAETVNAVVCAALRLLKVKEAGEAATADEASDGLIAVNDLIESWNLQPLMLPAKSQISQALTTATTYTFGTGGNNATRPVSIYKAFVRDSSGIDTPVNIIGNDEYSDIALKTLSAGIPYNLYYRASYPLGVVNIFPAPVVGYTLYLECQAALSTYTAVSDSINLPPGYLKALKYNLAIAISPEYKDPSQIVLMEAANAIADIKRMNSQDKPIMSNPARQAVQRWGYPGSLYGVP
jgi:hypothetical protein